jgi:hypothetical protein
MKKISQLLMITSLLSGFYATSSMAASLSTNTPTMEQQIYKLIYAAIENNLQPTSTQIKNWTTAYTSISAWEPNTPQPDTSFEAYNTSGALCYFFVNSLSLKDLEDSESIWSSSKTSAYGKEMQRCQLNASKFNSPSEWTNTYLINPLFPELTKSNSDDPMLLAPYSDIQNLSAASLFNAKNKQYFLTALTNTNEFNHQWLYYTDTAKATQANQGKDIKKYASTSADEESLLSNSNLKAALKDNTLRPELLSYIARYKSSVATRSVAINALENIAQGKSSQTDSQEKINSAIDAFIEPDHLQQSGELSIEKDQLVLLVEIEKQLAQSQIDQEKNTEILSALLLKINGLADTGVQQQKNKIGKMLDKAQSSS